MIVAPRSHNLVVVRAGNDSLHRQWTEGPTRDFDLCISYYGDRPDRYRGEAEYLEYRPGPKWPCLAALLDEQPALCSGYANVWFPDDDIAADTATINRLFAFVTAYQLALAQPALTRDSFHTWRSLLQDPAAHLRFTGFIEVMVPVFSRQALAVCRGTFAESPSGWGLDWVWPVLCRRAGLDRFAVIDATPVRHTRPVGGELYRNHRELDPRADAQAVVSRYGIEEVRAVAQYSVLRRVLDRPLPWPQRWLHGLKRLNGRRKLRRGR